MTDSNISPNSEYKVTMYVKTSVFLINKENQTKMMSRPKDDIGTLSGHVFFGVTFPDGKEQLYGFGGKAAYTPEIQQLYGTGQLESAKKPMDYIKGTTGIIVNEDGQHLDLSNSIGMNYNIQHSPHDYRIDFPISAKQAETICQFAEESRRNPPDYKLLTYNCGHWVRDALNTAGLSTPPQPPMLYIPAIAGMEISFMEKLSGTREKLSEVRKNIRHLFSGEKLAPSTELLSGFKDSLAYEPKSPKAFGFKDILQKLSHMQK